MNNQSAYVIKAKEWIVVNGIEFAVSLISFIVVLIIGKIVVSTACNILDRTVSKSPKVSKMLRGFLVNVTNKVLWIIVMMIALQELGVDIGPLIAGLGVTGFVVGFAFQESLGNLAAGLMIALNEPFKAGNFVEINGIKGVIKELNMMATTLTTPDNKKVVVPNGKVWGSAITNYSAFETRRVELAVGVSYGSDISRTKEVLRETLAGIPEVLETPAPVIEIIEMGDSAVNFTARPWCKTADYWSVYFKANHLIKEALDKAGITIPFPQIDVHHHNLPTAG